MRHQARKALLPDVGMVVLIAVLFWVSGVWSPVLLGVLQIAPLVVRRRAPGWVLGVVTAATVAHLLVGEPRNIEYLPVLISLYLAPSSRHPFVRRWLCGLAAAAIALAMVPAKGPIDGALLALAISGVAWTLGVEKQRHLAEPASERRELTARRLHDTLAQTTTVILLQGEALRTSSDLTEADRTRLDTMLAAGRATLTQVRQTVRELDDDSLPPDTDVAEVLSLLTAAGLVLTREPDLTRISWPVRDLADRFVVETATNALRHNGPGVLLDIQVEVTAVGVCLTARNRSELGAWRPGYGLTSLDKQLSAAGGSLTYGPDNGDWLAVATISFGSAALGGAATPRP
jgi:signal transduction histidine kinase